MKRTAALAVGAQAINHSAQPNLGVDWSFVSQTSSTKTTQPKKVVPIEQSDDCILTMDEIKAAWSLAPKNVQQYFSS